MRTTWRFFFAVEGGGEGWGSFATLQQFRQTTGKRSGTRNAPDGRAAPLLTRLRVVGSVALVHDACLELCVCARGGNERHTPAMGWESEGDARMAAWYAKGGCWRQRMEGKSRERETLLLGRNQACYTRDVM